ncbi:hypothetical protein [Bailinhaonella thermotolerans]|uniref:Uncharacterized protein n=1 Tax=Bailinhaonella thermotolerans TaxID=1070861 RepID=A0A3A4BH54_9ACTN|nr:hypothetical protein [Bailinhaonella thermotolerans]RJL34102.1 hypothetical protein D5H75_06325 [Bailinhaonella thermotolerans]
MSSFIILVVAVIVGITIGRLFERASEARSMFTSYRARAASNFRDWIKQSLLTLLVVVGFIVFAYVILQG